MSDGNVLLLSEHVVDSLLDGCEQEIMDVIRNAYEQHSDGRTVCPHSSFVRLPPDTDIPGRAIALPAYVPGNIDLLGIKWITSFPDNVSGGRRRANATIVLNAPDSGQSVAIMEGTRISSKRTAASAALAAQSLSPLTPLNLGIIGTGPINFEVIRFITAVTNAPPRLIATDLSSQRLNEFAIQCQQLKIAGIEIAKSIEDVFLHSTLVSIATNAAAPHISSLPESFRGGTILHLSLRDLHPELICSLHNIVDDSDHVLREQTSLHLAEQSLGHHRFIHATLVDVLRGCHAPRRTQSDTVVFSPFGLGSLDIALASFVFRRARQREKGIVIEDFLEPGNDDR